MAEMPSTPRGAAGILVFKELLWHRGQTQGPRAESGPPPGLTRPGTLFPPSGSTELSLNC